MSVSAPNYPIKDLEALLKWIRENLIPNINALEDELLERIRETAVESRRTQR